MSIKIRFRFNMLTGEVEQLQVDQERELPQAEHDATHEALAKEVGRLLDRFPEVDIDPDAAAPAEREPTVTDGPEEIVEGPEETIEVSATTTGSRHRSHRQG